LIKKSKSIFHFKQEIINSNTNLKSALEIISTHIEKPSWFLIEFQTNKSVNQEQNPADLEVFSSNFSKIDI